MDEYSVACGFVFASLTLNEQMDHARRGGHAFRHHRVADKCVDDRGLAGVELADKDEQEE